MANFNNDFTSSIASKPSFKGAGVNNENELNPELASRLKSPNKKQLTTKHFMSPTISAAIKANVPKKRILTERNETLDVVEPNSLVRSSSSFGSKPVKFEVVDMGNDDVNLKPYDPIKNYLSPRPKFLRYNPNRRRNASILKGNEDEDSVKSSISSLDDDSGMLPSSSVLELGVESIGSMDSCLTKESVDEVENVVDKKSESEDAEGDETEDENEDETVEFGENRCLSLKGFLKFLFVVIAVIVTTQAICSMNLPSDSHTLESVWSLNGSYNNVYGSASLNFCEVDFLLKKEADLVVYKGLYGIDEVVIEEEVENDETDVIQIDMWNKPEDTGKLQPREMLQEIEFVASEVIEIDNVEAETEVYEFKQDTDHLQQIEVLKEQEMAEIEVMEIDNVEAEREVHDCKQEDTDHLQQIEVLRHEEIAENEVIEINNVEAERQVHDFNQDGLTEEYDSDTDENNSQLTADACEIAEETKTSDVLIKLASFDQTFAFIFGLSILILIFVGVIYHSKRMKSSTPVSIIVAQENNVAEKQEIKILNLEPVPSDESTELLVNTDSLPNEGSKEISYIHAPSVELLGEFVFGEEVTSSIKSYNISVSAEDDTSNSLIQPTTVSSIRTKLSHMEMSTGDSHTVKKQKRKNSEVSGGSSMVTPSPVRRSSRIRSRPVTSP